jgi:transcriptional regulator with XRE-family HTH domain
MHGAGSLRTLPVVAADQPGFEAYIARGVASRRAWLQLDQGQLAERLGWARQTVSDLERGRRRVMVADLPQLCRALECDLAELARGASREDLDALGLS